MPKTIRPPDAVAWRAWLDAHHAAPGAAEGVWVVFWKKAHATPGALSYDAAVEEALCFGWVDTKVSALDEKRYKQYFCPRRPGSAWSESNRARVARLTRAGRMHAAGLAAVKDARARGTFGAAEKPPRA